MSASIISIPPTSTAARARPRRIIGQVLGPRRKEIILATKFGLPFDAAGTMKGGSRSYIMIGDRGEPEAAEDRLHRPLLSAQARPDRADRGDAARARRSREAGQGARDRQLQHGAAQIIEADETAKRIGTARFVASQDELSLIKRGTERERIPAMQKCGLAFIPYFPLASGLLTGKYRRNAPMPAGTRLASAGRLADVFMNEQNLELTYQIGDFCERRKLDMLERRVRVAAVEADRDQRHRRRGEDRPDRRQREGDRLQAIRRRSRGTRKNHSRCIGIAAALIARVVAS